MLGHVNLDILLAQNVIQRAYISFQNRSFHHIQHPQDLYGRAKVTDDGFSQYMSTDKFLLRLLLAGRHVLLFRRAVGLCN